MASVSERKKKIVAQLTQLFKEYPIVGVVNMENIPAMQLQGIRENIRKNAVLMVAKKRLIKLVLKNSDKTGIDKLEESLVGQPGLLFTKENPFKLFMKIAKNKTSAPAKAGQTSTKDVVVSAGPTSFSPGPIIGQLGKFGIKTGVEGGKLVIKDDSVVVKDGEVISAELASILSRLKIEPMEIGLYVTAMYEDGLIYKREVLDIDPEEYMSNIMLTAQETFNLAMYIDYPCKETVEPMVTKSHSDAYALALSQEVVNSATVGQLMAKAENQARALGVEV